MNLIENFKNYFSSFSEFGTKEIIAEILSLSALVLMIILYQQKDKNKLLIIKFFSDTVSCTAHFLLGAYTAFAICVLAMFRSIIFLKMGNNKKVTVPILIVFMVIGASTPIFTWTGPQSILVAIASVVSTFSYWLRKPSFSRKMSYPISLCMLPSHIITMNIPCIFSEFFNMISATIGIIRLDRKSKELESKEN